MTATKRPRPQHQGRVTVGKGKLSRRLGEVRRRALTAEQRSREAMAYQLEEKGEHPHCRWCSGDVEVTDRGEGRGRRVTVQHMPYCKAARW